MIAVNGERLWGRLMEMAKVGATAKGGCNRQALTDEDIAGRELFMSWCRDAGCTVHLDQIGNIFARRPGKDMSLPAVMTGSHLDTQPTGGKYDGILGVLAGLEVIETLNDHNVQTAHPIDVVAWCNEEGCRFTTAMMGSAVWSGTMPIEDAWALADGDGHTVKSELERAGHSGHTKAAAQSVTAAFELHIEQGPVLEEKSLDIGIVTGVQNMSRHEIVIEGQEAHAGPTPMHLRKDPMMALAQFLPRLYKMCAAHGPEARVTFGVIHAAPASNNTVPGRLRMTIDIRHPDKDAYQRMLEQSRSIVLEACAHFGLPATMTEFFYAPGVTFAPECVAAVEAAVESFDYKAAKIVSGAGHDACNVASVAPTSMIFIPCKDGISHNEAEEAQPGHVIAGANVLLHALLSTSKGAT